MTLLNVALMFGGESVGHNHSVMCARSVYQALDRTCCTPLLVGVAPDGKWWLQENTREFPARVDSSGVELVFAPAGYGKAFVHRGNNDYRICHVDVAFPISPYVCSSMLEAARVPFVGSRGPASAICGDKQLTKRVLLGAGLPIARYLAVTAKQEVTFQQAQEALCSRSLFVKPANLHSSIGVSKVTCESEFNAAINLAFGYDSKVVVEEHVLARELECAILQDAERSNKLLCSWPSEIIPTGEHAFFTAQAKADGNGVIVKKKAELDEVQADQVRALACQAFRVIGCEGLARVDFFMRPDGELLINEVGTAPVLGPSSMFSRMLEESGIPYKVLVQRLLEDAIERSKRGRAIF